MKPAELKYNERSWAIDLIAHINQIITDAGQINRAGGEFSLVGRGQALFPDLLLFGDRGTGHILQGWELKMPDTPIDNIEFYENAKEKAMRLGLSSFLLWNAIDVKLYIYINEQFTLCTDFKIDRLPYSSRQDVHDRPDLWKRTTIDIITRLNIYFSTGKLQTISASVLFSDKGLIPLVLSSQADVKNNLEIIARNDHKIDAEIKKWWRCVHGEYPGYDSPFAPLAFTIILRWFNRFVFSNILYAYGKISINLPILSSSSSVEDALIIFEQISSQTDYWNIIGPAEFDNLLPSSTWNTLLAIFTLLQEYDFSQIDKTILSEIIQSTVLLSIKKAAGLFSTPQNVAELLVRLTLWNKESNAIDPFCGTGTIVKNILEIKGEYNIDGKSIVKSTWACDKFGFPVQIANLSVASPEIINESFQIFTHDAFKLFVGEDITFISPKDGKKISKKLPIFDSIISNLPFVAFEDISDLNPEVYTKIEQFYLEKSIVTDKKLDGRSDLYSYIPFILLPLLNDKGTFGIIVSNSWLSTKAGNKFRKLLREVYNIVYVLTSAEGRWFHNTDVVTNMIVLQKKSSSNDKYNTCFVSLKIDINSDVDVKEIAEDIITYNKESEYLEFQEFSVEEQHLIETYNIGFNACFGDCHWLLSNMNKFKSITFYANIARGERRGWDQLFYPEDTYAAEIEPEYIKNVYKTAKGSEYYDIIPDSAAFCCDKSLDKLYESGHLGAYSWIKRFENATNEKGESLPQVLSRSNMLWYEMPTKTLALFALSMNPDKKICFFKFSKPSFVNQRLISISPKDFVDTDLMHALLNSIFCISQIEAIGFGRGLGVLDINSTIIKEGLYLPDLSLFSIENRNEIVEIFNRIKKAPIKNTIQTLNDPDWMKLNNKIAKSLGMQEHIVTSAYRHFSRVYKIRKSVGR